jgi:hypothetical protein
MDFMVSAVIYRNRENINPPAAAGIGQTPLMLRTRNGQTR